MRKGAFFFSSRIFIFHASFFCPALPASSASRSLASSPGLTLLAVRAAMAAKGLWLVQSREIYQPRRIHERTVPVPALSDRSILALGSIYEAARSPEQLLPAALRNRIRQTLIELNGEPRRGRRGAWRSSS